MFNLPKLAGMIKMDLGRLQDILSTYIGGQAEIQSGGESHVPMSGDILRGQIRWIGPRGTGVEVQFDWLAQLNKSVATWNEIEAQNYYIDLTEWTVTNIGPGREGGDRLFFSDRASRIVSVFPPDGSKLDYDRVIKMPGNDLQAAVESFKRKQLPPNPNKVIIEEDDLARAKYVSSDLKPCPFCGKKALSFTEQNPTSGNFVAKIFCPDCLGNIYVCQKDKDVAKAEAKEQWNRRV